MTTPTTRDGWNIYFDDPPIAATSDSRGLGPVNARILDILDPSVAIINRMRLLPGQAMATPSGRDYHIVLPGLGGQVVRALSRYGPTIARMIEPILIRPGRGAAAVRLFAPLGSEIGAFSRARLVARRIGATLVPYLVDDPLVALRGRGTAPAALRRAERFLAVCLADAPTAFCITAELAERLAPVFSGQAHALPLPYGPVVATDADLPVKPQILYLGSVNEIYRRELRHWVDVLDRAGFFAWGTLLSTGAADGIPHVTVRAFDDRHELNREIARSIACLLPISSRESDLHRSSFPSKLLDYLAHGRAILCSAPVDSIAARFFREADLPILFPESAIDPATLAAVLRDRPDHGALYRAALDRTFSAEAFLRTIMEHV